jgi:hypothetical protein
MNAEELDRELDAWLDRATAEYGNAEIRPQFETRIIAKLNSGRIARRWHFRLIWAVSAVAAILLISVYSLHDRFQSGGIIRKQSEMHPESAAVQPHTPNNHAKSFGFHQSGAPALVHSTKVSARFKDSPQTRESLKERFMATGLSDRERYLISFVQAISQERSQDMPGDTLFDPLSISQAPIPAFRIQDFQISAFEIEDLPTTTPEARNNYEDE